MFRGILTLSTFLISMHAGGTDDVPGIFRDHCIKCHGKAGKIKGKIDLTSIRTQSTLAEKTKLLSKLIEVVDFHEMPPEDQPALQPQIRTRLLDQLRSIRQQANKEPDIYSHAPIRRMNRFQYNNAVIDLFDLTGVVFSLPERMMREHRDYFKPQTGRMADAVTVGSRPLGKSQMIEKRLSGVAPFPQDLRAENGFDNRGDHLSMSPLLLESFLKLAQSVVNSRDFNSKTVGIWKRFFEPPPDELDPVTEARSRLRFLLQRAFRRPPSSEQVDRYTHYAGSMISRNMPFSTAMRSVAAAIISSPRFLYLYDTHPGESTPTHVHDLELASRLSFFLWGSIPDEALLKLAITGKLSHPAMLEKEFQRMLRDQKLKRFCDSFPSQWLQLERLISSVPNPELFPDFYFLKYRDSMHMMMEPLLIFETVLIENMPITQLIDSDFTYRSSLLQEAYKDLALDGKPVKGNNEVTVLNFKRTPVTDRRNGGIITNAAVMTMTSGPEETKPITRGAWLATVIFNKPPDPPPANVPPLTEKPDKEEAHLTLRERLSMHREQANCRGCHEQIDPLGFALENYDAIGNWRTHYENGREINVSGTLFRNYPFTDVLSFKDKLLAQKDRFTRALAGHLLSFALARELGPSDAVDLEHITKATAADDYRIQTLLREIVFSKSFMAQTTQK